MLSISTALAVAGALWSGYFFYAVIAGGFFSLPEAAAMPELSLDAEKIADTVSFYETRALRPKRFSGDEDFFVDPSR